MKSVATLIGAAVLLPALCLRPLQAADAGSGVLPPRPTVRAVAIESRDAPQIDGDVNDAVWARAEVMERFYDMEPIPLEEPQERTEVRILYDRNELYVALHAFYTHPEQVAVSTMERDVNMRSDDVLRVMLDPRLTRREGYFFEMNAVGARREALILGGTADLVSKWNMLWRARSRRVADGWTAEFAIPFRGLSYEPGNSTWGLDISREYRRGNESMRWAPAPPGTRQIDLTYEGTLTGLSGMTQGGGLDVMAYATGRVTRNWLTADTITTGHPSATAYYKITPAFTGLLTLNTDFSDAPLDSRQVNTTRFSLFEPETREFFLEDADAFEFGNFGTSNGASANGRPFFSRNLGLVGGKTVNLDAGVKLSGDLGGVRIGALSVRTGGSEVAPAQTLSAVRMTRAVLGESRIGAIVTDGDPTGKTRNRVAGADFLYRRANFRPGKQLNVFGYLQRSFSSTLGDDGSFGGEIDYPNEPFGFDWRFKQLGQNYKPALGFVNRPGIRSLFEKLEFTRRPRTGYLRKVTLAPSDYSILGLDNRLQSGNTSLSLELQSVADDQASLGLDYYREVLSAPFALPGNVPVPVARYGFFRPSVSLQTSRARRFAVHWQFTCCDYYGGRSAENDLLFTVHTGVRFGFEFRHRLQTIRLPGGRSTIHIETLNATRNVTPEMKLVAELQYDNVSHQFGASLRYRWEIRPTTELLVTLGESATLYEGFPNGRYRSQATAASIRLGHRFQY